MSGNERINIFVSTFKDTYNKVIEFGEAPSKQVTDHKLIDASDSMIVDEEEFEVVESRPKHRGPNLENKDKSTMSLEIA